MNKLFSIRKKSFLILIFTNSISSSITAIACFTFFSPPSSSRQQFAVETAAKSAIKNDYNRRAGKVSFYDAYHNSASKTQLFLSQQMNKNDDNEHKIIRMNKNNDDVHIDTSETNNVEKDIIIIQDFKKKGAIQSKYSSNNKSKEVMDPIYILPILTIIGCLSLLCYAL